MLCGKQTELNEKGADTKEYQCVVGTLLYASKSTRPDIANAARNVSQHMICPNETHINQA